MTICDADKNLLALATEARRRVLRAKLDAGQAKLVSEVRKGRSTHSGPVAAATVRGGSLDMTLAAGQGLGSQTPEAAVDE